jgi:hypothetical protein
MVDSNKTLPTLRAPLDAVPITPRDDGAFHDSFREKRREDGMGKVFGRLALAIGLIAGLALAALGAGPAAGLPPVNRDFLKTEIYLGLNLPGGHEVARQEWNDFLDKVVTKKFPKGLTVLKAYGQMQHADGRIEEQGTMVLVIVHPSDPAADKAVGEVVEAFRARFGKVQVMVLRSSVTAQFYAD